MSRKIFTVGYEAVTLADVLGRLKAAGVRTVVDVRAVAASRRAGFSKTLLSSSLEGEGIAYVHLRDLGTPKAGREAARKGRIDEMRAIFVAHMQEPAARLQFEHLKALAADTPAALLCYEADACGCHRAVLAERLAAEADFEVVDL